MIRLEMTNLHKWRATADFGEDANVLYVTADSPINAMTALAEMLASVLKRERDFHKPG